MFSWKPTVAPGGCQKGGFTFCVFSTVSTGRRSAQPVFGLDTAGQSVANFSQTRLRTLEKGGQASSGHPPGIVYDLGRKYSVHRRLGSSCEREHSTGGLGIKTPPPQACIFGGFFASVRPSSKSDPCLASITCSR